MTEDIKEKLLLAHMRTAFNYAMCSTAVRLQVGAIVVKDNSILSFGYNGTPPNDDNRCEHVEKHTIGYPIADDNYYDHIPTSTRYHYVKTKNNVIHAEENAIAKLARSTVSSVGSTLFLSHAPCIECSKLIGAAGIAKVYFHDHYRSDEGTKHLQEKYNIPVIQLQLPDDEQKHIRSMLHSRKLENARVNRDS